MLRIQAGCLFSYPLENCFSKTGVVEEFLRRETGRNRVGPEIFAFGVVEPDIIDE